MTADGLIERRSLPHQVYDRLKGAIIAGKWRPDSQIVEKTVVEEYGVSHASVRQALVMLEQEGFVVRRPHRGATVPNLFREDVQDLNEVRIPLEVLALTKAAERLGEDDYAELGSLIERMRTGDADDADLRFHRLLWERSGNPTLAEVIDRLVMSTMAFVQLSRRVQNLEARVASHAALIDAIRTRNPAVIEASVQSHVEGAFEHFEHFDSYLDLWEHVYGGHEDSSD